MFPDPNSPTSINWDTGKMTCDVINIKLKVLSLGKEL